MAGPPFRCPEGNGYSTQAELDAHLALVDHNNRGPAPNYRANIYMEIGDTFLAVIRGQSGLVGVRATTLAQVQIDALAVHRALAASGALGIRTQTPAFHCAFYAHEARVSPFGPSVHPRNHTPPPTGV